MYSIIVYFFTNLSKEPEHFLIFLLVLVLATAYGCSMGFLLGCCFDELHTAMQLMNLTTLFPIIYGGLAVNLVETPMFPLGWV